MPDTPQRLVAEAERLGRYLVGRAPSPELAARYAAAHGALLEGFGDAHDAALVRCVQRHPWSLGFLDAACGLVRPDALLRRKLVVMAAVLEATPDFADDFLPRATPRLRLLVALAVWGAAAAARAAVGLLLYPLAVRA